MRILEFFRFRESMNSEQKLFAVLFERYYQKVYKTIFFITGNRDLSEDLTQDTFLQVMTNIGSLRDAGSFEAWLSVIAANKGREGLRMQGRDQKNTLPLNRGSEFVSNVQESPERLFEEKEIAAMVARIVNQLDDIHKEVIILRYYWGLSEKEMANLLKVQKGTVKSRLNRAKNKISTGLKPYFTENKDREVNNSERPGDRFR